MSAPFAGPPPLPFATSDAPYVPKPEDPVHRDLAGLLRPRKHYQWYYSTRPANADMHRADQGVHDFLRAYYHHKSADWKANQPYPLKGWTASELAKLPTYYVMDLSKTMAETVAEEMPSAQAIAANPWLPDRELAFYSAEYARTGFQGGLQWYRCGTSGAFTAELQTWSGRTIDVPSCFISGKQDWGTYQRPGVYEAMQSTACTRMIGCHMVDGAGHWVQQEQPAEVSRLLLQFLERVRQGATA
jgi:pimeloyl-ACP methyl ester carboxylesterase